MPFYKLFHKSILIVDFAIFVFHSKIAHKLLSLEILLAQGAFKEDSIITCQSSAVPCKYRTQLSFKTVAIYILDSRLGKRSEEFVYSNKSSILQDSKVSFSRL